MNNVFSMWPVKVIFISLIFGGFFKGDSIDDPSPMMKLNRMEKLPYMLMSQPDIEKAGEILASNSEYSENSLAQSSGIEMFEEAFGITSNITSFSQEAMGLPFFNTFNNVASELGLLFSLKQFAFEIYEGKEEQAKLNLAKNLTLYSLGKWGTRSLKIANAGIFFIDYSLTKFGTKGLEVREEKYQKEYDILLPWQSPRRDKIFWTRFITDVVLSTKDFNASLDKEMDVYLKYPFTQKDFPKDLQEILIQKEKEKLLKILHEAVKDAKNQLEEKRKKEILDKFGKMKSMLNEKLGILVRVFEGNKGLSGVPVKIIVNKDHHLWAGKTDKDGQWWFDCTRLGYLHYGRPTVVEIQYKDTTYKRNLSIDNWRNGRIEFILDGEEEEEEKLSAEFSIIEPLIHTIVIEKGIKEKEVSFSAYVKNSSTYRYLWDFGDGKTYEDKPVANKNSKVSNKYTNINENSSFKVTVKLFPLESQEELSTSSIVIDMNSSLSDDDKYNSYSLEDAKKYYDLADERLPISGTVKTGELAYKIYLEYAKKGNADAQYMMGYLDGTSIKGKYEGLTKEQQFSKSLEWYILAAKQGHAEAQFVLGEHYNSGFSLLGNQSSSKGAIPNPQEALKCFEAAAMQGHDGAMASLSQIYWKEKKRLTALMYAYIANLFNFEKQNITNYHSQYYISIKNDKEFWRQKWLRSVSNKALFGTCIPTGLFNRNRHMGPSPADVTQLIHLLSKEEKEEVKKMVLNWQPIVSRLPDQN